MKYNRAFIIRNDKSLPILSFFDTNEDSSYWLFESGESFHGAHDNSIFYFRDSRIPSGTYLPLDCVELEFGEEYD